jgi:hypothetical protein
VSITATGPTTILDTSPETFDGIRFLAARDTGPVPPVTITLRFVDAVGGLSPKPIDGFDIGNSINLTTTAVELCRKISDGVNQVADLISATASIPSLNFIPLTTFGNWF